MARVTAVRPSAAQPSAAQPSVVLSTRYGRAFDIAVVIVVVGWHVAGAGGLLLSDRASYGSDAFQVAAWMLLALVIAAGSVRLLTGLPGRPEGWALAGVALVTATAAAAACPAAELVKTDWAWGAAGWAGVLVLLRRPMAELAGFLSLEALATFGVLARDGLNRQGLAGFITVLAGSAGIQLAVAVAARALNSTARQAADAAHGEAAAREHAVVAGRLRASRYARWLALQETAEPLLSGLAAGSADPGDAAVRGICAVEAARLRRLLAESDESPGPLVHELHATADVAERRGVAVDIETAGALPGVPPDVRRVLTDTAIAVLTATRSHARITVAAVDDGIAVSLVADTQQPPLLAAGRGGVVIEQQRDRDDLWVEARWNGR